MAQSFKPLFFLLVLVLFADQQLRSPTVLANDGTGTPEIEEQLGFEELPAQEYPDEEYAEEEELTEEEAAAQAEAEARKAKELEDVTARMKSLTESLSGMAQPPVFDKKINLPGYDLLHSRKEAGEADTVTVPEKIGEEEL